MLWKSKRTPAIPEALPPLNLQQQPQQIKKTIYFRDGKRKIDAILVYERGCDTCDCVERDVFLINLQNQHLDLEEENSLIEPTRVFVKIHANDKILIKHAKKHGIPLKYEQLTVLAEPKVPYKFLKTILNDPHPDPRDPIARRAWPTISKQQPKTFTFCERSTIVFTIMEYTKFGDEPFHVGLSQLLYKEFFIAAYPLHDGPWEWPENDSEPLNDRQLLAKYWANYAMKHKQQPLNTIEKYFGPETALYFGWLGFYNKMLIIASGMGILAFIYGIIDMTLIIDAHIEEACESEVYICPPCYNCKPKQLRSYCVYYRIAELHDNFLSAVFASAMSFWATFFMEFWKRRYATMIVQWNLDNSIDDDYRPQFQATAKYMRPHEYTRETELYTPTRQQFYRYTLSVSVVIFMILIVVGIIFVIILYECALKMTGIEKIYISTTSALMTIASMEILRKVYGSIAMWLTNVENPRTQLEFDKSYMIKMVLFCIINNYGKLLYIAFFKGKFFTYPGDPRMHNQYFPIGADVCDPTGCVTDVFILLATITICKPIMSNFVQIFLPIVRIWYAVFQKRINIPNTNLHMWEQDYYLNSNDHFRMMEEMEDMVMQYGRVTILVAAFPLAPLLALMSNLFEIRIDCIKLVKYYRRPESAVTTATSITVWFDTIQALTYFAVVTNALFITFTSNFIPKLIYFYKYNRELSGFNIQFQLSQYEITGELWKYLNKTHEICYYPGHRYPPGYEFSYDLSYNHWYILSCRLGFAIFLTLTVLCLTAIIAYAIPDIPSGVRDLIIFNTRKLRHAENE